jgi:hypothetical protein
LDGTVLEKKAVLLYQLGVFFVLDHNLFLVEVIFVGLEK